MPRGRKMIVIQGSTPPSVAGMKPQGNADPDALVAVTLHLRSKNHSKAFLDRELAKIISGKRQPLTHPEWGEKYGASPDDLAFVEQIASEASLSVNQRHQGARMLTMTATSARMGRFFGVKLQVFNSPHGQFTGHSGPLKAPSEIARVVEYVSGLDDRPQNNPQPHPHWITVQPSVLTQAGFLPTEVAKLYGFPKSYTGKGQTIGVIELGGGIHPDELKKYCAWMKTPFPPFVSVTVHGVGNSPSGPSRAFDGETAGDIETIAGVAPGARIVAYFAGNSNHQFLDAVRYAVHDSDHSPTVISISWGDPECKWSQSTMQMFNQVLQEAAVLGITVCCSSGDYGSSAGVKGGGLHVCFPASSPFALACGGTHLEVSENGNHIKRETVWNNDEGASGGGFSNVFPMPSWQKSTDVAKQAKRAGVSGRGMPDVASDGDPTTGYIILVDGKYPVGAGTSAASPVWAGLIACINEKRGRPLGFINPFLYANYRRLQKDGALRAITVGNNGAYKAGPGWNACTGFGTPDGSKLMNALTRRKIRKRAKHRGRNRRK